MRRRKRNLAVAIIIFCLGLVVTSLKTAISNNSLPVTLSTPTYSISVVSVTDGDTIKVDLNGKTETIRLIGIDTPETKDPRKTVQCFGQEASAKMTGLVSGQSVSLEADPTQEESDKYGRLLRYVFLSDGTNVNLLMIKEGYAHEYTYDLPYKYQKEFRQAETDARTKNLGLWSPTSCNGNTSS